MAFDELIRGEFSLFNGLLFNSVVRWTSAANRARTSAYSLDDLFQDARAQFVENWDTWNQMMGLPTNDLLPTVTIRARYNALLNKVGHARVNQRLTFAAYEKTPLERFGGGAPSIPPANYEVDDVGNFEGAVRVKMLANVATVPAGPAPDVYRGMVLAKFPGMASRAPLAWVAVVAEP